MLITLFLCVTVISFSPAFSDSDDRYKSKSSDDYVPCHRGWYYFRGKCYGIAARRSGEKYTWTRALELCKEYRADLVSIQSRAEQNFIVAYLLMDVKSSAWIGLNDRDKEGDFRWNDGSVFNYSDNPFRPGAGKDADQEDCVHLVFEPEKFSVGKWIVVSCESKQYVLCEKEADPNKRSPNLMYCSPEEGGGWKHESSCYHIFTGMKSWQDAERYCKINYEGHLLTIRDPVEDLFLELALPDIEDRIWIGIKLQDQYQQKWTSGWYVSYDSFYDRLLEYETGYKAGYVEGTCIARINTPQWTGTTMVPQWRTTRCSTELPFICEASKANPPALQPPPAGSYCPKELDEWRDLGGDYCYYIFSARPLNFFEANFACQRRGGDLLSIHSQEEADVLFPFVRSETSHIYIGLVRLEENNGDTFGWTDKSVLDYQKWDQGEPKRATIPEKCVQARTLTMEWAVVDCKTNLLGYICKIKKIIPDSNNNSNNCANFCIAPTSHLFGLLSQCPYAKRIW